MVLFLRGIGSSQCWLFGFLFQGLSDDGRVGKVIAGSLATFTLAMALTDSVKGIRFCMHT